MIVDHDQQGVGVLGREGQAPAEEGVKGGSQAVDVAALVDRLILIDKGRVRFDGGLREFSERYGTGRRITVRGDLSVLGPLGFTLDAPGTCSVTVPAGEVNPLLQAVLERLPSADVSVHDPPLEDVLARAFGEPA